MLKENLVMLRKLNGYSQEDIAEKIDISRQAYGKWESGETTPDIEKCALLADVYGISIDGLIRPHTVGKTPVAPAPLGKHIFGTVFMNDRGQIVIPKEARDVFHLESGSKLIVLGDEAEGIALVKAEVFEKRMETVMKSIGRTV